MSDGSGAGKRTLEFEEAAAIAGLFLIAIGAIYLAFGPQIHAWWIRKCAWGLYVAARLHFPGALSDYRALYASGTSESVVTASTWVGGTWRIVTVPLLVALAAWLDRRDPARRLRTRLFRSRKEGNGTPWKHYDLKGLLWLLAQESPCALPAARAMREGRLTETPAQDGPWAQHIETIRYYKQAGGSEEGLRAALKRQLGRPIPAPSRKTSLPKIVSSFLLHEQALLAVFALYATDRGPNKEGDTLLDDLSRGFREGPYDAKGRPTGPCLLTLPSPGIEVRLAKILHDEQVRPFLETIMRHHGFSTTIMMRALDTARRKGMLPPSRFLWLKPADRVLWYPLHELPPPIANEKLRARRVVVEAAGAYNHYKVEFLARRRQEVPCLNAAVAGVMDEVKGTVSAQGAGQTARNN